MLQGLPIGVCAIDADNHIAVWNLILEKTTGIKGGDVVGHLYHTIDNPWAELLSKVIQSDDATNRRVYVEIKGKTLLFNLHKAGFVESTYKEKKRTGTVILLEDITNIETLEAELAHHDRLASIGHLAAGVAHEIGNPVTGIMSLAQNLKEESESDVMRQAMDDILSQSQRINQIIRTLTGYSRQTSLTDDSEKFRVKDVIDDAVHLLSLRYKKKRLKFVVSCTDDLQFYANQQKIEQVLMNVLANAADASKDEDEVMVFARTEPGYLIFEVMDQGVGIDEHMYETIFEPFYTTKATGKGTGLGLALVYQIIKEYNGAVEVDSQLGYGTRMMLKFPIGNQ